MMEEDAVPEVPMAIKGSGNGIGPSDAHFHRHCTVCASFNSECLFLSKRKNAQGTT